MPQMLRNIWLPNAGEQQTAQAMITEQVDIAYDMQPATFPTIFRQQSEDHHPYRAASRRTATSTGGRLSLYVNNEVKPFDDRDVRWALSHYIDRDAGGRGRRILGAGAGLGAADCRPTSRCCLISTR